MSPSSLTLVCNYTYFPLSICHVQGTHEESASVDMAKVTREAQKLYQATEKWATDESKFRTTSDEQIKVG